MDGDDEDGIMDGNDEDDDHDDSGELAMKRMPRGVCHCGPRRRDPEGGDQVEPDGGSRW